MIQRAGEFERECAAIARIRIKSQRENLVCRGNRALVRDQRLATINIGLDVVNQRDAARRECGLRNAIAIGDGNRRMM